MQKVVDKNTRIKNRNKHMGGPLNEKKFHVEDLYNLGIDTGDKKNFVG